MTIAAICVKLLESFGLWRSYANYPIATTIFSSTAKGNKSMQTEIKSGHITKAHAITINRKLRTLFELQNAHNNGTPAMAWVCKDVINNSNTLFATKQIMLDSLALTYSEIEHPHLIINQVSNMMWASGDNKILLIATHCVIHNKPEHI